MAKRPLFIPLDCTPYVQSMSVEFQWHGGFARSQRIKCIQGMHQSIKKTGWPGEILEISSASEQTFGQQLSAMNLMVSLEHNGTIITQCVETIYQSAKVFGNVGPHPEWLTLTGQETKKKVKEVTKSHGAATAFEWNGRRWSGAAVESFYSWIYIQGLMQLENGLQQLSAFSGFTDVYFNPKKTVNCQARTAAQTVQLWKLGLLEDLMESPEAFENFCQKNPSGLVGRIK